MQEPQLRNHGFPQEVTEVLAGRDFQRSPSPASCSKQDQHHQQIRSALPLSDSIQKPPRVRSKSLFSAATPTGRKGLPNNIPRFSLGPLPVLVMRNIGFFFLCNTLPVAQADFRSPPWYFLHQRTGPSSPTSPGRSQSQAPSADAQTSPSTSLLKR